MIIYTIATNTGDIDIARRMLFMQGGRQFETITWTLKSFNTKNSNGIIVCKFVESLPEEKTHLILMDINPTLQWYNRCKKVSRSEIIKCIQEQVYSTFTNKTYNASNWRVYKIQMFGKNWFLLLWNYWELESKAKIPGKI